MENQLLESLRARTTLEVAELSLAHSTSGTLFPTFLQADADVHGSHGLFYWLRARSKGLIVRSPNAGLVLSWRADIGRLVAFRPVGDATAAADLVDEVARNVFGVAGQFPLLARYCGTSVAHLLRQRGWIEPSAPWVTEARADDETYPEVVVTGAPTTTPGGHQYNLIRKAINLHANHHTYRWSPTPLGCGEAEFIASQAARADGYDEQEKAFNEALLAVFDVENHEMLRYHYLFQGDLLCGFAITGHTTHVSHMYYLGTTKASRLSAYFQWMIYLEERNQGAEAMNLGGSETESLFTFKTRTFRERSLQASEILQYHP